MNFASHFFLDGIKGKPYYNFGLILPDLMSIYKRGWRITDRAKAKEMIDTDVEILNGMLKHFELDAIFHQSMFFNDHTKLIKDLLKQEKLQLIHVKKHFVAHVLLELLIDRVIIKHDEKVLFDFYNCLDRIEKEKISHFFNENEPGVIDGFFDFYVKFRERRFLYKYSENETIIFILNKVLERVGLLPFTILSDIERLDMILSHIEIAIDDDFARVLEIRNMADV